VFGTHGAQSSRCARRALAHIKHRRRRAPQSHPPPACGDSWDGASRRWANTRTAYGSSGIYQLVRQLWASRQLRVPMETAPAANGTGRCNTVRPRRRPWRRDGRTLSRSLRSVVFVCPSGRSPEGLCAYMWGNDTEEGACTGDVRSHAAARALSRMRGPLGCHASPSSNLFALVTVGGGPWYFSAVVVPRAGSAQNRRVGAVARGLLTGVAGRLVCGPQGWRRPVRWDRGGGSRVSGTRQRGRLATPMEQDTRHNRGDQQQW